MSKPDHSWRPPLPERHQAYVLSLSELRAVIEKLHTIHERTRDEEIVELIGFLEQKLIEVRGFELICQADELQEFYENPSAFTHTLITWMFNYREKEMN